MTRFPAPLPPPGLSRDVRGLPWGQTTPSPIPGQPYDGGAYRFLFRPVRPIILSRVMKIIQVKVKPNARVSALEEASSGPWLAQLKAPPVDGKANKELVALIARHFACPKSAVSIKSGASGRMKLVKIDWT